MISSALADRLIGAPPIPYFAAHHHRSVILTRGEMIGNREGVTRRLPLVRGPEVTVAVGGSQAERIFKLWRGGAFRRFGGVCP